MEREASKSLLMVQTTVDQQEQARKIARHLIEQRLAACVQIDGPIASVYVWQEELCETSEYRLTIKTLPAVRGRLLEALVAIHPYEVPEVLEVEMQVGLRSYAEWAAQQVEGG
ncbi:MAG: cation tolerance protein CutA [Pirellulaceae bacterium]|nr:MAG: cation tolerance protein CutA [Pirellulaceae bacterium]